MKFTPIASCRTRISCAPGSGVSTSASRSTSGPPFSSMRIAFISVLADPMVVATGRALHRALHRADTIDAVVGIQVVRRLDWPVGRDHLEPRLRERRILIAALARKAPIPGMLRIAQRAERRLHALLRQRHV